MIEVPFSAVNALQCSRQGTQLTLRFVLRPSREHTELEEELHETAHIDYDRVAIVSTTLNLQLSRFILTICQVANPSVAALYEDALVYETGSAITSTGALTAYSGAKTGRSPLDKRVVKEPGSEKDVWWGPVNKPMTPEVSFIPLLDGLCTSTLGQHSQFVSFPP